MRPRSNNNNPNDAKEARFVCWEILHLSKGLTLPPAVAAAEENSSHQQQQQDVGEEKKSTFRKIESRKNHLATCIWKKTSLFRKIFTLC
jgi:hypothetical protein